jgi:nucleoside-diphosphate-sugar epimerase
MTQVAIRAVGLGRRYAIGKRAWHLALRDIIANIITAPARLFGSNRGNGNISRDYIWALNDVSFEIQEGEVVDLIGRNGGKQIRDNVLNFDVVRAFEEFARNPRPGEVYNVGGGRAKSVSMVEGIARIEALTGRKINWTSSDQTRKGDLISYISNLAKLKRHYPECSLTRRLDSIFDEMVAAERDFRRAAC